jgi:hypothetical protein
MRSANSSCTAGAVPGSGPVAEVDVEAEDAGHAALPSGTGTAAVMMGAPERREV